MQFRYPIKDIKSLESFYKKREKGGFYPIGRSNVWHGGVHVEGDNIIQAIAEGEIVAYRIDEEKTEEKENTDSNKFILIKHLYKSPNGQELTFYSLYNHLLSYDQIVKQNKKIPEIFLKEEWELNENRNLRKWDSTKSSVDEGKEGIVKLIPKGTLVYEEKLTTEEQEIKGYKKFKCTVDQTQYTGFMSIKEGLLIKKESKERDIDKFPVEKGKVKSNITIPIKANTTIGYSGLWNDEQLFHFEIFAPNKKEVEDFLGNEKKDGENEKLFLKLYKDAELDKKYLGRIISKGWKVEITEGDKYSKVKIISKEAIISRDKDVSSYNSTTKFYAIKLTDELNQKFDNLLTATSSLNYIEDVEIEKENGKDTRNRKVLFNYPLEPNVFFVPKEDIQINENSELTEELKSLYEIDPTNNGTIDKIQKERIIKISNLKKIKVDNDTWYHIEEDNKEGWIKENDAKLKKISAYDWKEWGFENKEEAPDDFIFDHSEHNKLMLDVCDLIETIAVEEGTTTTIKKDGNISIDELKKALKNQIVKDRLSHLVCWHTSEWACDKTSDAFCEQIKKMIDEAIKDENNATRKQNLENERDNRCKELNDKIADAGFWKNIPSLPQNGQVYHFHPIAFIEQMLKRPCIIFPLLTKPLNDKNSKDYPNRYWKGTVATGHDAAFNSSRSGGKRKHAGRDLYAIAIDTDIVAIADGVVLAAQSFYEQTNEVTILHETNDGRKFIIRYGEVSPNSITVSVGDKVIQKQIIAKVGKLKGSGVIQEGKLTNMLHFEYYTGSEGYNLSKSLTNTSNTPFQRRSDLEDSVNILEEGYENTFGEKP